MPLKIFLTKGTVQPIKTVYLRLVTKKLLKTIFNTVASIAYTDILYLHCVCWYHQFYNYSSSYGLQMLSN